MINFSSISLFQLLQGNVQPTIKQNGWLLRKMGFRSRWEHGVPHREAEDRPRQDPLGQELDRRDHPERWQLQDQDDWIWWKVPWCKFSLTFIIRFYELKSRDRCSCQRLFVVSWTLVLWGFVEVQVFKPIIHWIYLKNMIFFFGLLSVKRNYVHATTNLFAL